MAAAAAAVTVSLTYVYAMNSFNSKVADVNERQAMYAKLSEIDQKARQDYVGEIDEQALTDALCAGYVAGLGDSGAKYYSAARYQEYRAGLTGRNVGVGVSTVQDEDGNMEIVDVLPGSAAEKAGLQAGDVVLAIDGREVIRLTYGEAVNKLDGTAGTTVELSVLRPAAGEGGQAETLSFTVTRAEYVQRSVTSAVINGNVGYLAVSQFREDGSSAFSEALSSLLKQGVVGLVIDLRNNSGGDMQAMAESLDMLVPAGSTVTSRDSSGTETVEYTSSANEIGVPVSVLVNGSTYGAAELFAADVQDYGKGLVVGEQTAGSGEKLEIIPLSDGSAMMLPIAEYLRIGGGEITGSGVTPDVEKSLDEDQAALLLRRRLEPQDDAQVQAAVTALVQQGAAVSEQPGGMTATPAQQAAASSQAAESQPAESQAADSQADGSQPAQDGASAEPSA